MTVQQPTAVDEIEKGATFVNEHILWVLGLIPLGFACFRILIVSGGSSETLKALVQNLNVTALALATLLPFLTTALIWVAIFSFFGRRAKNRSSGGEGKNGERTGKIASTIAALLLLAFATPVAYLLANLTVIAGIILMAIVFAVTIRWPRIRSVLISVMAFAFVLTALLLPFIAAGMWLPKEEITVLGQKPAIGYVLSSGDGWTKYMGDDKKVYIVESKSITRRISVADTKSWYQKTPYRLLFSDT